MKEEEFQKKVISKLNGIEKRLRNIEKKLDDMESAVNSISEDFEDEEYEGEGISTLEPEDNHTARILPPHKDIKGYI